MFKCFIIKQYLKYKNSFILRFLFLIFHHHRYYRLKAINERQNNNEQIKRIRQKERAREKKEKQTGENGT